MASPAIQRVDRARLEAVPVGPGCYLFRDAAGTVIYVGKAASLRERLRFYFTAAGRRMCKVREMAGFEVVVTDSELEALVLENNLIRELQPRYNVTLRARQYPYLCVTTQEPFPRVLVVRERRPDGNAYFGPYPSRKALDETVAALRRLFPYRTCDLAIPDEADDPAPVLERPCLEHFMGRCAAPCVRSTTRHDYRAVVDQVMLFLRGRRREVVEQLRAQMAAAAAALDFERAARLRDRILAVERAVERQKIASPRAADHDVIALAHDETAAAVEVFHVRGGEVVGRERHLLETGGQAPADTLRAFIQQRYAEAAGIPPRILLQHQPGDAAALRAWLARLRGGRVSLVAPRAGEPRRLVDLVAANARQALAERGVAPRRPAGE